MTLPANLRINNLLPFPAQVTGGGPISITKANGIWQINFNPETLGQQSPSPGQLFTDTVVIHDHISGTNFNMALSDLVAAVTPLPNALTQRLVTGPGPVTILSTDRVINLNCSVATTVNLPAFADQGGVPLTFKDVGGQATSFNITLAAAVGEAIEGQASILLDTNYASITLLPANDGTTVGWYQI